MKPDTHDLRVYLGAVGEAAAMASRHLAVLDTTERDDVRAQHHAHLVAAVELLLVAARRMHAIVDEQRSGGVR